tara:strand:- start:401 stop:652 length:252 start_codon:yes stop_codon:yes gene_type:complete
MPKRVKYGHGGLHRDIAGLDLSLKPNGQLKTRSPKGKVTAKASVPSGNPKDIRATVTYKPTKTTEITVEGDRRGGGLTFSKRF